MKKRGSVAEWLKAAVLPPPLAGSRHRREKLTITDMYTVYILRSGVKNRFYVGHTADMDQRLSSHNEGKVRSTKSYRPWKVVYTESLIGKNEAYKREMQIKSYKGGRAFHDLFWKASDDEISF